MAREKVKRGRPKRAFTWQRARQRALADQRIWADWTAEQKKGNKGATRIVAERHGVSEVTIRNACRRYEKGGQELLQLLDRSGAVRRALAYEINPDTPTPEIAKGRAISEHIAELNRAEEAFWRDFGGMSPEGAEFAWLPPPKDPIGQFWHSAGGQWLLRNLEEAARALRENGELKRQIVLLQGRLDALGKPELAKIDLGSHSRKTKSG